MTTVVAEKAEAMRRYNNRKSFRNILRTAAVASLCFLWFPTVVISLQAAGDWFYRTGAVFITDRFVVFVIANLLVALIFVLSSDNNDESSDTEPDLYDQYTSSSNNNESTSSCDTEPDLCDQNTSSSAVIVTASAEVKVEDDDDDDDDDDSSKQIVPAFMAEADLEAVTKGIYRRTKSEMRNEIIRPVMEIRRTESAKVVAKERLSSEELQLKADAFIMKMRKSFRIQENDVVQCHEHGLLGAASGYGSC